MENTNTRHETKEFQAEVKQLLDIVVNSIYTDREIFLRELVSNAADALEKLRYQQVAEKEVQDSELPLEISIDTNESESTLTITDSGIGMTREEVVENLGTIAHSGSKAFLQHLMEENKADVNLIGQFGLGFYASFMVADKVSVYTRSYQPEAPGCVWTSEGAGSFTVDEVEGLQRGTKVVLQLKDDAAEFAKGDAVKRIIKQYSSFVPFSILVDGEKINTVQAIWTKNKNEVSEEEYTEFYKYIANAHDEPLLKLHLTLDAPLSIQALLFVPQENFERFGFGRMEPGVNVYCRKVLIQEKSPDILPEWMRFLRGVVDSEELPLSISRENMQDSALVSKLRKVITGRVLKFLNETAKKEPEKYKQFWDKFSMFIKEGAASDFTHQKDLVKLLRFESSRAEPDELVSLQDYLDRMQENQDTIYFINGPNREAIESGPYMEAFKNRDLEVLYTKEAVDDYILNNLGEYEGKKLVSADQQDLDLPVEESEGETPLSEEEVNSLCEWVKETLGEKVTEVRQSKRLVDSPAVVLNPSGVTGSIQRMMQVMHKDENNTGPKTLEINARHEIIKNLNELRQKDEQFAKIATEQIFDNALVAAGLILEPRYMVDRIYKIMDRALQ
ncbi:MAG: molecular chaperone HtpG [Clostridiales bacterium]|nr:molecular chaperone HtpG [Clostridiales bacterium]MCF8023761.1 molecular chaperone HtpG [Clostridiales bacterium]